MQRYPVRASHRPNLRPEALEPLARTHFDGAVREGDSVTTRFGAIARLSVKAEGRELGVELAMDPKVSEEIARETIARYNRFLRGRDRLLGSKERAKRVPKERQRLVPWPRNRGAGAPATEIDRLRAAVSAHFPVYETRVTPQSLILLVHADPATLEARFDTLRRELWEKYYVPQIRRERGRVPRRDRPTPPDDPVELDREPRSSSS